jgi:hypothetical protein
MTSSESESASGSASSSICCTILSHLQEYSDLSQTGNDRLKSSLWQITKLRIKQTKGTLTLEENLSAEQVREELRARILVKNITKAAVNVDEPELTEETLPPISNTSMSTLITHSGGSMRGGTSIPTWKMVDAIQERVLATTEQSSRESNIANLATNDKSTTGLRQRKNTNKTTTATNTDNNNNVINNNNKKATGSTESPQEADMMMTDEDKLLHRDPLELFVGVRPLDLKVAQMQAKEALHSYIQAANQAALILAELEHAKQQQQAIK